MISCVSNEHFNSHCVSVHALSSQAFMRKTDFHLYKEDYYLHAVCALC